MLTWRPLTTDDAPALTRAYAAVEAVDRTGEHFSERDVREELEDQSIDFSRDSVAALTPDGEVLAFAWVRGSPEVVDSDHFDVEGAVVPTARGQGLGARLLAWAEERAADLHRERHPGVPGAVCIDVIEGNPSKQALVRAAGYEATRWWHRMSRSLEDPLPDVPPTPPGLTLARYTADRDEATRLAYREAFAGHWGSTPADEQRWRHSYTGIQAFRPDVSWLALDGDDIAGFLLSYFWEADAAGSGVREVYVGQLGVRPRWRRRGVGALLLASALHSYRSAGYEASVLTVDTGNDTGALGLYERAGFVLRDTAVTWTKPLS